MIRRVLAVMCLAGTLAFVAGCSDDDGGGVEEIGASNGGDRGAVLADIGHDVIVPAIEKFSTESDELVESMTALCAAPSEATLAAAQDAWNETLDAWWKTAAFRFGPAETLRTMSDVAFIVDVDKIEKELATPGRLPDDITLLDLKALGADTRGLYAMEPILFSPGAPGDLTPKRCSFAAANADLVAFAAASLEKAWTVRYEGATPFVEQFAKSEGYYTDDQAVIEDVVNGSIGALTAATDMRLGRAIPRVTGEAEPATVDSGAAQRTLDDVNGMIESVRSVFGTTEGKDPHGLSLLVAAKSSAAERRLDRQLRDAASAVEAIPKPLATATDAATQKVITRADSQLRAARTTLRTEVASLLGITLSFSDSDGDS